MSDMRYLGSSDGDGESIPELTPEAYNAMVTAGLKSANAEVEKTRKSHTRRALTPSKFAVAVRAFRLSKGWTQRTMAAKVGCSISYISNFEAGGIPTLGKFSDIARKVCGLKVKGPK